MFGEEAIGWVDRFHFVLKKSLNTNYTSFPFPYPLIYSGANQPALRPGERDHLQNQSSLPFPTKL